MSDMSSSQQLNQPPVTPVTTAASPIFESTRKITDVVARTEAVTKALAAHPEQVFDTIGKTESTIEVLNERLANLVAATTSLMNVMQNIRSKTITDPIDRIKGILETCDTPPTASPETQMQLKQREVEVGRTFADAHDQTREGAESMFVSHVETMTAQVSCRDLITQRTVDHWRAFARLHFKRAWWRLKMYIYARSETSNPCGRARRVLRCFEKLREVYERQRAHLRVIAAVAREYEDYGVSYVHYQEYLMKREHRIVELMTTGFVDAYDYSTFVVKNIQLREVDIPDRSLIGAQGLTIRRHQESVRRLKKRKPWLFVQESDRSGLPPIQGSDSTERFNEPQVFRRFQPTLPSPVRQTYSPPKTAGQASTARHGRSEGPSDFGQMNQLISGGESLREKLPSPPQARVFDITSTQGSQSPRRHWSQGAPVTSLCDKCRFAKAHKEPPPLCRSTGCAVANQYVTVERRIALGIGDAAQ